MCYNVQPSKCRGRERERERLFVYASIYDEFMEVEKLNGDKGDVPMCVGFGKEKCERRECWVNSREDAKHEGVTSLYKTFFIKIRLPYFQNHFLGGREMVEGSI